MPSAWTLPSLTSLLTGLAPHVHRCDATNTGVVVLPTAFTTFAEALQNGYGYETLAYLGLYGRTDRTETDISYQELSHGFRNDVGFVAQSGVRKLVANQNVQWFGLGPFNQLNLYLNTQRT